jgi:DNA-directed RNA polymerases I, II, and III subunit RPABC4
MSSAREEYQVPQVKNEGSGFGGQAPLSQAGRLANEEGPAAEYICGDCAAKVQIKRKETLRCVECGGRVLYKERTKRYVAHCKRLARRRDADQFRMVQFEAR